MGRINIACMHIQIQKKPGRWKLCDGGKGRQIGENEYSLHAHSDTKKARVVETLRWWQRPSKASQSRIKQDIQEEKKTKSNKLKRNQKSQSSKRKSGRQIGENEFCQHAHSLKIQSHGGGNLAMVATAFERISVFTPWVNKTFLV